MIGLDEQTASLIAESWRGGDGWVPRGPRWLLGYRKADRREARLRTGWDAPAWRLEAAGRFLRAGGVVYPGGVPFPEELQHTTAIVAGEAWLYVSAETLDVEGVYAWPDAVRRPIAGAPRADFPSLSEPGPDMPVVEHREYVCAGACEADGATVLVLVGGILPDPLNEMLLYEQGGLTLQVRPRPVALEAVLAEHSPPFRRLEVKGNPAAGREPGRSLGPQTLPWPGQFMWNDDTRSYELRGFAPLDRLREVALSASPRT